MGQAPRQTMDLWPNGAPGPSASSSEAEHDTTKSTDTLISGRTVIRLGPVSRPTLTLYPVKSSTGNGKTGSGPAVIVFPGGAYHILAMDLEGTEICDWLNSIGVTAVLVKYRVPSPPGTPRYSAPLEDAQRAVGMVREHAAEWHIDSHRIGVLGFSAGGHLSAAVSTNYSTRTYAPVDAADQLSCRPDFAVLIYPGYLANEPGLNILAPEIKVSPETPPTFLVQTEDDPVHVENSLVYYQALKQAGVPAEMHIFSKGGHGYGMRPSPNPVTGWPKLVETWFHTQGIF